jgi:hypothetical protein
VKRREFITRLGGAAAAGPSRRARSRRRSHNRHRSIENPEGTPDFGLFWRRYFVIIRRGGALGVCSAGESTNVSHTFQPSGRFWLSNSRLK